MALLMSVLDEDKRSKLNQYELRSFVETNPHLKWCPAPGCEHAVHCHNADGGAEPMDITCNCGCTFCFACYEEGHRPVWPPSAAWCRALGCRAVMLSYVGLGNSWLLGFAAVGQCKWLNDATKGDQPTHQSLFTALHLDLTTLYLKL